MDDFYGDSSCSLATEICLKWELAHVGERTEYDDRTIGVCKCGEMIRAFTR
jgi:hypothetical protein